jgi:phospholipase/carboxylesterase
VTHAPDRDFMDRIGVLGPALLRVLESFERVQRYLHPPHIPQLQQAMAPVGERLDQAIADFEAASPPPDLRGFSERLLAASRDAQTAVSLFHQSGDPAIGIAGVLGAMRAHCRAQEAIFPLRGILPPVNRFFLEADARDRLRELDPDPPTGAPVGLHNASNDLEARGGFSFYVPESYDGTRAWPLVVALHGGSGHGADFLWSWLREARSRQLLLLAPTARGSTWSLNGPDIDASALRSMVEFVSDKWNVDSERVLLTGLSDGATYSLLCGLQSDTPFSALAPLSGVLHPANFANGNIGRAAGRRIYLVHGALDWMFPVQLARAAAEELEKAGADLVFREIEDLSHTYARDENARILDWFLADGHGRDR